jgi:Ni,Fe-hydrogenase III large subunit/Ni,Fe-hydrogenase III component G
VEEGPVSVQVAVPLERLAEACSAAYRELGATLATMVALDDRAQTGQFRLVYVFAHSGRWISIEAGVDPARPRFPSVTPTIPAAHWYEREAKDMLGLIPEGHPDPRRLVLHDDWPEGVYPLRKDFDPSVAVPREAGTPHRFHHLHGEGIVEIPVGPIHAGVIEPGHFRFAAVGEVVLHLETRLFYSHRGIEKLAEGQRFDRVLQLAERICGACAFSHAVAYCQAIESLAGVTIPARAAALRTLFLELERLYNHVGDLGNICAGVGFAVGASQGGRLKEELQRLNGRLAGHRFLRGVCRVGGVRGDPTPEAIADALGTLRRLEAEFGRFVDMLMSNEPFIDRMVGTGIVPLSAARDLGAVGVAARASGVDRDARRDHPHAYYSQLEVPVVVRGEGDVRARARVRIDEALVSFRLARALLEDLPTGPLAVQVESVPSSRTGVGVTESPRGECVHWVRTGPDGLIDRYRVRSASFCNWPVVALSVPGNMVPDFPLINKSFELCYSCLDR